MIFDEWVIRMSYVFVAIVLLVALYVFLIFPRRFRRPDLTPLRGVHYAHRGLFDNASGIPENSLFAFRRAIAEGYGIELDVQLSKDGQAVVFHDASLLRMCGIDGLVGEYTLEELRTMSLLGTSETIPTFSEVLATVDGKVPLIIEYKLDVPDTTVCELGNALLSQYRGPYCIESFHPKALIWYRKNRPDVIRGQLSEAYRKNPKHKRSLPMFAMQYLLSNVLTRPDFIAYRHRDTSNLSRRLCRCFGALSVAWTIQSQSDYERVRGDYDLFIFDSVRL